AIGFTSFAGSLGWFWAFSLSFVAFVKAVGQVESVASVLLAIYLWKEQKTRDQLPGIALTIAGIFLIVLS
ncbi:MAG: EamA family transporter, partial [Actinomycetota bacterium]